MKTGDIIACKGNRLLSKLIMKFTNSKYSHVSVAVNINGDVYIAEMQKEGCILIAYDNWQKKYNYTYEVYEPFDRVRLSEILSVSGVVRYDRVSLLIRQPIKIIREKIFGKKLTLDKHKDETSKMTCSEYVAWLYRFDNFQDYTPDDVVKECIKMEWKKT